MSSTQTSHALSIALADVLMEVVKVKERSASLQERNDQLMRSLSSAQEACFELLADNTHLRNEYHAALQQIKDLERAAGLKLDASRPKPVVIFTMERGEWLGQNYLSTVETRKRLDTAEQLFATRQTQKALVELGAVLNDRELSVGARIDAKILIACIQRGAQDRVHAIATLNEAHDILDRHPALYQERKRLNFHLGVAMFEAGNYHEAMNHLVMATKAKGYEKAVDLHMKLVEAALLNERVAGDSEGEDTSAGAQISMDHVFSPVSCVEIDEASELET